MKRITKEMCMIYIKDHYKLNLIVLSILSVFAVVAVGFFTKNVIIAAVVVILGFFTIFFITKATTKNSEDFYLVEDVIVDCQKKSVLKQVVVQGIIIFTHFAITVNILYIKALTRQLKFRCTKRRILTIYPLRNCVWSLAKKEICIIC